MSAFSAAELAGWYDTMVDWSKRLSHETPFFRRWFSEAHAQRVLDVACGSGHHAALFHQWGLVVEGADLSHAMLELARRRHGTAPGLTWTCRGFTDPLPRARSFRCDAVCRQFPGAGPRSAGRQTGCRPHAGGHETRWYRHRPCGQSLAASRRSLYLAEGRAAALRRGDRNHLEGIAPARKHGLC